MEQLGFKNLTSPYKVYWAIFTPATGKVVTKKDKKALSGHS